LPEDGILGPEYVAAIKLNVILEIFYEFKM
jgi:hypothetical protein